MPHNVCATHCQCCSIGVGGVQLEGVVLSADNSSLIVVNYDNYWVTQIKLITQTVFINGLD